jgi:hypothetical protein
MLSSAVGQCRLDGWTARNLRLRWNECARTLLTQVGLMMIGAVTVGLSLSAGCMAQITPNARGVQSLDWDALLPDRERPKFRAGAPAPIHDYLGESAPPAKQVGESDTNPQLDGAAVMRLTG